jgi:uncharacterized protein (TIGR03435 family)
LSDGYSDYPVVDRTGLTEKYDLSMRFALRPPADLDIPGAPGSTLEAALKRQLGLKLKKESDEVRFLIIDHIEAPSAN